MFFHQELAIGAHGWGEKLGAGDSITSRPKFRPIKLHKVIGAHGYIHRLGNTGKYQKQQ